MAKRTSKSNKSENTKAIKHSKKITKPAKRKAKNAELPSRNIKTEKAEEDYANQQDSSINADDDNSQNSCDEKISEKTNKDNEFIAQHIKLKCEICNVETKTFLELKHHFSKAHKCKGYVTCCNKRLNKRFLILDHINLHLDANYFA